MDNDYEINLGSSTILISDKYKIDSRYDVYQSCLYSVIASLGNYTIISEPNMCFGYRHCNKFALYYKNKSQIIFGDLNFKLNNFNDILFIRCFDKRFAFSCKDKFMKTDKLNRYIIEVEDDTFGINNIDKDDYLGIYVINEDDYPSFSVIDLNTVRKLLLDSVNRNNINDWVVIDITDKVKSIQLKDKLERVLRRYFGLNNEFMFNIFSYYIDYETDELYLLIWIHLFEDDKLRFCLFRSKIESFLSEYSSFKLVWDFETDIPVSEAFILNKVHSNIGRDNAQLRLLVNKWNIANGFISLKALEVYDKGKAYYDYGYNRRSITAAPVYTAVTSTLHLVRCMTPTF